jgi:hypothetical protein
MKILLDLEANVRIAKVVPARRFYRERCWLIRYITTPSGVSKPLGKGSWGLVPGADFG